MTEFNKYKVCISSLFNCASACSNFVAKAVKNNYNSEYSKCIQLAMECSVLCYSTAELLSLDSSRVKKIAKICAKLCDDCAAEFIKYPEDHFQETAELCVACADNCELII